MYSSREKITHFKSPYSRVNLTAGKIVNGPQSENNLGRSRSPVKTFVARCPQTGHIIGHHDYVQIIPNLNGTVLICDEPYMYGNKIETPGTSGYHNRNENVGKFRPRKSELEERKRTLNQSVNSANLKMMSLGDVKHNSKTLRKKFNETNTQELVSKGNVKTKKRQNLFRIFTGSVQNVSHWYKLKRNLQILFEVTATLVDIQMGKWKGEKILLVSDSKTGPSLQVLYYEIDRPLPKLTIKTTITCVGRLITRNCLQAYKVDETSEESKSDSQRLGFICNRVAEEIMASTVKPKN